MITSWQASVSVLVFVKWRAVKGLIMRHGIYFLALKVSNQGVTIVFICTYEVEEVRIVG